VTAGLTVLCGGLPGADGATAAAAALAVALAADDDLAPAAGGDGTAIVVEVGERRRGPTMIAAEPARALETRLRDAGFEASARGRLAWVALEPVEDWCERLAEAVDLGADSAARVIVAPPELWGGLRAAGAVVIDAALLRAELPAQRSLAALAVGELRAAGVRAKVAARAPGRVGARRALAGIDPGGDAGRRARRLARGLRRGGPETARLRARLGGEQGQSLPMVVGACLLLVFFGLILTALGGAVAGKARAQRVADLSALSAARSMRDDFDRLFAPARLSSGAPNPRHLDHSAYLARARAAALDAARHNDADPARLEVSFPDRDSFAPLRTRIELEAELGGDPDAVEVHAEAEAVPPASSSTAPAGATMATGGGYSGPLAYRQGEGMRPDVAAAYDRMEAAARVDGIRLLVASGFRSDAEQAALFAANPNPQWVAPPGTSLHRCATELDLGPSSAYGWLAANAPRFGFVKRYSWEPWHFGYADGPAPCSAAGDQVGSAEPDPGETSLPAFVPARYRRMIIAAGSRWNVSASLLAAQLMVESNFNPFAVSWAGAAGIAQFMPATAAAYGLDDPFDAAAAIDAQAHLMSDLLRQFGGNTSLALAAYNAGPGAVEPCHCVPAIPETQAYVARILGLMGGAGEVAAPTLEVRLVD
jgi:Transglycosylase SLT domain/D-alanyl-D-alanine carboxypeptidase/Putative Flp pilus-assembly TadE/G-like